MSSIRDYVMEHSLFCSHDHHFGFGDFEAERASLSYRHLLDLTAEVDLATAGGPEAAGEDIDDERFAVLWPRIRATGSGRAAGLTCRELFNLGFTPSNFGPIDEAIRAFVEERTPAEIYGYLVRERAQNVWTVNDITGGRLTDGGALNPDQYPSSYWFTFRWDSLFMMEDAGSFEELESFTGLTISTLAEFGGGIDAAIDRYKAGGRLAAIKIPMAYYAELGPDEPTPSEAQRAFSVLRAQGDKGGRPESEAEEDWTLIWKRVEANPATRVLGAFALHRLVQRARAEDLPVQIHTGFLAGLWMPHEYSKVTKLISLFERYRTTRFDILHASWPWTSELGAIAKTNPNVWIDMALAWVVNPAASVRALSEWLDCVPFNKILAYGADTDWPWANVGLSLQAKLGIAQVLEQKTAAGHMSQGTAEEVADRIMLGNGEALFGMV